MKKQVFFNGLPVLVANVIGSLVQLAAIYILSFTCGKQDILAFGLGSSLYLTFLSFLAGLMAGTIAYLAGRVRRGEKCSLSTPILSAVLLSALLFLLSSPVQDVYFHQIAHNVNVEVVTKVKTYFFVMNWTFPCVALNMVFSSYIVFNGKNWQILKYNLISSLITLLLTFSLLVYNPTHFTKLQFISVSILAGNFISLVFLMYYVHKHIEKVKLRLPDIKRGELLQALKTSAYSGGQVISIVAAATVLMAFCGRISPEAVAVMSILMAFNRAFILPSKSFGISVGAIAAKKFALGCSHEGNLTLKSGIELISLIVMPVALSLILFPSFILETFLPNTLLSRDFILSARVAGLSLLFEPFTGFLSNALKTQGMVRSVFYCTLYQWIVVVPFSWYFCIYLGYGLSSIWFCIFSFRVVFTASCWTIWKRYSFRQAIL